MEGFMLADITLHNGTLIAVAAIVIIIVGAIIIFRALSGR